MKQENKQLLLKDLCARLPYALKVKIKHYDDVWELLAISTNGTTYATRDVGYPIETYFEDCKPFLFPLSSMTLEQRCKVQNLLPNNCDISFKNQKIAFYNEGNIQLEQLEKIFNFFNLYHIDYRGLIPMGLANDATGLNIY